MVLVWRFERRSGRLVYGSAVLARAVLQDIRLRRFVMRFASWMR